MTLLSLAPRPSPERYHGEPGLGGRHSTWKVLQSSCAQRNGNLILNILCGLNHDRAQDMDSKSHSNVYLAACSGEPGPKTNESDAKPKKTNGRHSVKMSSVALAAVCAFVYPRLALDAHHHPASWAACSPIGGHEELCVLSLIWRQVRVLAATWPKPLRLCHVAQGAE